MEYIAAANAWAHAHPYVLTALAAASANRRFLLKQALLWAVKTKWGRRILLGHEDDILADIDEVRGVLKEVVDAEKAAQPQPVPLPNAP